jgi:hypothetical protein
MNPKEKAEELLNQFIQRIEEINHYNLILDSSIYHDANQFALIAADEIIKQWDFIDTYLGDGNGELNPNLRYWMEVKKELEK